jgi:divinyl protochlorophyllide a 8-vinyl-reductase
MAKTPTGYLRRPALPGFMAPRVVLDLLDAVTAQQGAAGTEALVRAADLVRIPSETEPVREDKAARLHQSVATLFPDLAPALLRRAGQATADRLMATQQSLRAQTMLAGAPWPIAAWLLGRWAQQHDWTFIGTGRFSLVNALEFELADNPLIRGFRSAGPACHWHAALFERLFQRMVDPDLECRELVCAASGAPVCRFIIARP